MGRGKKIFSGILSALLAFTFISLGVNQITPKVSREVHKKLYHEFSRFSKVHPAVKMGYQIDPKKFMPQIGMIELICGVFLVIGPRITKLVSCLMLTSITVGALYLKYVLKDPREQLIAIGFVLLLLFIRLNLYVSASGSAKVKTDESEKQEKKEQ